MTNIEILLHVDSRSGFPVYQQIVDQVRRAVAIGILKPGDQLPTVKQLASTLVINPATVSRALRELEHLDIVRSHPGRGAFVRSNGVAAAAQASAQDVIRASIEATVREARSLGVERKQLTGIIDEALDTWYRGANGGKPR